MSTNTPSTLPKSLQRLEGQREKSLRRQGVETPAAKARNHQEFLKEEQYKKRQFEKDARKVIKGALAEAKRLYANGKTPRGTRSSATSFDNSPRYQEVIDKLVQEYAQSGWNVSFNDIPPVGFYRVSVVVTPR